MNIKVLSITTKHNKTDITEYSKDLEKAFAENGDRVDFKEIRGSIPFIELEMKKSLQENIDFMVIANALGDNCEMDFRKLFAGIIYRGEAKVQEKLNVKPKKSFKEKLCGVKASIKAISKKLKNLTKKHKERPEIPEISYNKKKTQVFSLEIATEDKTAYTFSYRGTKVVVLPTGTKSENIPEIVKKAKEKFIEKSKEFPNGYRLIPKTYRVLTFTQRYLPQRFDCFEEKLRKSVLLVALCVFVVTGCMLVYNIYVLPMQNEAIQSDIQTIFYETETDAQGNTKTAKEKNWGKLKKINSDIKGWIQINDTKIDYPILQCKSDNIDNQFYLYHDYKKNSSSFGSIFIDYRSKKGMSSKNVVIHGHHMMDGSMFGELMKYGGRGGGNLSFYKKSPTVQISTPKGGTETYKIISVFKSNVDPAQGEYFDFYSGSFKSDAQFMNYVYNLRIRSLINCPVTVNEDDQIISLVTCSYEFKDFRTVVVARKCRKGESPKVDVSSATLNNSAIWPQCYYSRSGGSRPAISTFSEALKAKKINWYDGEAKLKGSEELPTTVTETTEPTTQATEKATKPKVVKYTVKIYNRGKLISTQKIKKGGSVKIPKISKTYISGKYRYTFKGWKVTKGRSVKKVNGNMNVVAKYKKTKLNIPKPTKPTKPTVKPTVKPTEPPKPVATEATQPTTEPKE